MGPDLRHDPPVGLAAPSAGATPTLFARVVGAALLLATGWIHLHLWLDGYRDIRWIGPLFLTAAVLAALGAVVLLLASDRRLPVTALLAGLLEGSSLLALVLSLTVGLFGFAEAWTAPFVPPMILLEVAGFLLLTGFGTIQLRGSRQHTRGT